MEIGDVYTVEIPSSDGHEQAGARLAIVVQATRYGDRLPTVLIVPLTSRLDSCRAQHQLAWACRTSL